MYNEVDEGVVQALFRTALVKAGAAGLDHDPRALAKSDTIITNIARRAFEQNPSLNKNDEDAYVAAVSALLKSYLKSRASCGCGGH